VSDPAQSYPNRRSPPDGVGPYQTGGRLPEVPALAVGERFRLDLRAYENGRYVALSPAGYDSVSVTNLSGRTLRVELNDGAQSYVVGANTARAFTLSGAYVVEVVNTGSSPVSNAGDVTVEVQKEPLGADEAARKRARKGPVAQVVEHFTGLGGP